VPLKQQTLGVAQNSCRQSRTLARTLSAVPVTVRRSYFTREKQSLHFYAWKKPVYLITGVVQIDNVDLEILGLFTSCTDKACFGDLLNSKCFVGEAEKSVEEFLIIQLLNVNKNMCHFDSLIT